MLNYKKYIKYSYCYSVCYKIEKYKERSYYAGAICYAIIASTFIQRGK